MKKVFFCAVSTGLLVLLFASCTGQPKTSAEPTLTVGVTIPVGAQAGSQASGRQIIAEGQAVPVRSAALGLPSAGIVISVPVTLGVQVKAGDVLAQLDTRQLELQLAQAAANVAVAQAKLDQFNEGPTAQDVAAAQQNVASAQAAYDKVRGGPDCLGPSRSAGRADRGAEALCQRTRRPECRAVAQPGRAARQRAAPRATRHRRPTTGSRARRMPAPGQKACNSSRPPIISTPRTRLIGMRRATRPTQSWPRLPPRCRLPRLRWTGCRPTPPRSRRSSRRSKPPKRHWRSCNQQPVTVRCSKPASKQPRPPAISRPSSFRRPGLWRPSPGRWSRWTSRPANTRRRARRSCVWPTPPPGGSRPRT